MIATQALEVELPVAPMWGLVALGAVSNVWLALGKSEHLGAFLILDVALLTGLLYFSGGPTNPFSIIYVVYIAMSAVMLSPRWTWTIGGLSVLSFGALALFLRARRTTDPGWRVFLAAGLLAAVADDVTATQDWANCEAKADVKGLDRLIGGADADLERARVVLEPVESARGNAVALALFAVFWNGILSVFIVHVTRTVLKSGFSGTMVLLSLFLAIGSILFIIKSESTR